MNNAHEFPTAVPVRPHIIRECLGILLRRLRALWRPIVSACISLTISSPDACSLSLTTAAYSGEPPAIFAKTSVGMRVSSAVMFSSSKTAPVENTARHFSHSWSPELAVSLLDGLRQPLHTASL